MRQKRITKAAIMFKRITVLLLAFTMILAFTACSSDEPEDENDAIGEIESTDVVDGC